MESRARLAARVAEIAPFHVMEVQTAARVLEAAGRTVIHMEIGEPDFPTPAPVLAEAQRAIAQGGIYYTSALGLPELREAIAVHYADHYGVAVDAERVIVTAGSSAALLLVNALLLNRDDRILLADPGYPCTRHFIRILEGEPVGFPVGPASNYQLTAELIEQNWSPSTRGVHVRAAGPTQGANYAPSGGSAAARAASVGVLIASPSNPTGTSIARDEMQRVVATVAQRGGRLIVDEIYLGLTYDHAPRSALEIADDAFVISSFSKYFNMTGWRLGWLVAPKHHVRDLEKLAQNLYISPPTPSQRAALACFRPDTLAIVEERRQAFRARRDLLVPALRELGFGIPVTPDGGFFVYADCSRFCADSERFCRDVLEGAGVAVTPGIDFGRHRANAHVRFAYTIGQAKIEEGIARLARFLGHS